ncbi:MAG: branched-chain amino acid ABC transporter permease [Armatimonadetes bacterium]|nr:branched-chain amino acid ABC transporter permease [Armatimonadota bacterium]
MPRLVLYVAIGSVLVGLDVGLPRLLNAYLVQILVFVACNIVLATSLNLINGIAGQFSIGHAGFMAIGAYATAWLSTTHGQRLLAPYEGQRLEPLLIVAYLVVLMFLGGLAAALGGLLIGLPSLRLRGDYLAIATLGFGEIIRVLLLNLEPVGGATGLRGIPQYSSLFLVLVAAVVTVAALHNLGNSVHGRSLLAIREDETAAEALGIDCAHYKTSAFVIGAFFAGVAGCLYAHYTQFIHPRSFDFMKSIELVLIVVLGGGNLRSVILAAVAITLLPEGLRLVKGALHLPFDPRMAIYSALLIAAMLVRRERVLQAVLPGRKGGGLRE